MEEIFFQFKITAFTEICTAIPGMHILSVSATESVLLPITPSKKRLIVPVS